MNEVAIGLIQFTGFILALAVIGAIIGAIVFLIRDTIEDYGWGVVLAFAGIVAILLAGFAHLYGRAD